MANALRRGYATASTDTGHTGDDVRFGQGHPEKVIDYGWRAIHIMTDTAKLIVRNAQGRFADKSYFVGCSAGGHQAMSEAQRFPEDYDGIVAGAPANNRIRQTFGSCGRGRRRTMPMARRSSPPRSSRWSPKPRSPRAMPTTR